VMERHRRPGRLRVDAARATWNVSMDMNQATA
jgi:hypothetical protein